PVGGYIYTGRAVKNLFPRVERHCRRKKAFRWHIDYLLQWAEVMRIVIFPGQADAECAINLETCKRSTYSFLIPGFGSSDCRCPSHLIWIGNEKVDLP
ncbi:MAG: GIY-YIG nuclease family protein, partial [Deltaproteobacteria bacterium]